MRTDHHRGEEGSAMLLALVFLLLCMFTGSTVLASASANAGRGALQGQARTDFLHCRSAILLCRDQLRVGDAPALTVRDVTVQSEMGSRRTVTYSLRGGGDSILLAHLVNCAVTAYEQENGIPDDRRLENFPHAYSPVTETALPITVTSQYEGTVQTLTGVYMVENGTDASIRLTAGETNLVLTMTAVTGSGDAVTVTRDGVTAVTKTTLIQWEDPVIGKGGGLDGEEA